MPEFKQRISCGYYFDMKSGKTKQRRKTVTVQARNQREADAKFYALAEKLKAENTGGGLINTFSDLKQRYYEVNTSLKPITVASDERVWHLIKPSFGKLRVVDISADYIAGYLKQMEELGYSSSSIFNVLKTVKKYMNFAVEEEILARNPVYKLKRSKYYKQPKSSDGIEVEDAVKELYRSVFSSDDNDEGLQFKTMLLLSADAALRNAEMYGLTWDGIDLAEKSLKVNASAYRLSKVEAHRQGVPLAGLAATKTESSTRKVPLSDITVDYLGRYKKEREAYLSKRGLINTKGLLFFKTRQLKGNEVEQAFGSGYNTALSRYCQKHGIPHVSSHDLRKTAFTIRVKADMPLRYCKYILGHGENKCDDLYLLDMYKNAVKHQIEWEVELKTLLGISQG